MVYKYRTKCRLCSDKRFGLVLDLGKQPPSNSFLTRENLTNKERDFPLRLYICKKCYHLQLLDVVDKKHLFSNYHYLTSANKPIIEHFEKYANDVYNKILKKREDPFVIEIGSNDGTLLKKILKYKVNVLGIEPAKNLAKISRKSKIPTENDFFNIQLATKVSKKRKADLIIANNVLGHIDNLHEFLTAVLEVLKDNGVFVFEVPHALNLIQKLEFDTIYHEHISYFSIIPLLRWLKSFNLEINDVEKKNVHGGTIRVYVSKRGKFKIKKSVEKIKIIEKKYGMNKMRIYNIFTKKVVNLRKDLLKKINVLKKNNELFGYGAPAKGNVLLNYCKIDNNILDFITDTTKMKQGKYTPGSKIKIISPKIISKKGTRCVALLLAWNYNLAIINKERNFLKRGGEFLIPIPKPRLIRNRSDK